MSLETLIASAPSVRSVGEFLSMVTEVALEEWRPAPDKKPHESWYRGHGDISWRLAPGRYRGTWASITWDDETSLMLDFRARAAAHVGRVPSVLEATFLAQHHGIPTRLLDWTESALVALYFAVTRPGSLADKDACVWMLQPHRLNKHAGHEEVLLVALDETRLPLDDPFRAYLRPLEAGRSAGTDAAVAIQAPFVSPRIVAQRGTFAVFGDSPEYIERIGAMSLGTKLETLRCFRVPRENVELICEQLHVSGFGEGALFPDLDGLAREMKLQHE